MQNCKAVDSGEAGKSTLAGIDYDQDGIRDDIEHVIANMNLTQNEKEAVIQFSKKFTRTNRICISLILAYKINIQHICCRVILRL